MDRAEWVPARGAPDKALAARMEGRRVALLDPAPVPGAVSRAGTLARPATDRGVGVAARPVLAEAVPRLCSQPCSCLYCCAAGADEVGATAIKAVCRSP